LYTWGMDGEVPERELVCVVIPRYGGWGGGKKEKGRRLWNLRFRESVILATLLGGGAGGNHGKVRKRVRHLWGLR